MEILLNHIRLNTSMKTGLQWVSSLQISVQLHSRLGVASMAKSKSGHGLTSRTASTGPARVYTDEGQGTFRDSSDCFGG